MEPILGDTWGNVCGSVERGRRRHVLIVLSLTHSSAADGRMPPAEGSCDPLFRSDLLVGERGAGLTHSSLRAQGASHAGRGSLAPSAWDISGDVGLVSAGRIDKDTPPLTTPSHASKSSAMDISSHTFQIDFHGAARGRFHPRGDSPPCVTRGQRPICVLVHVRGRISPLSGTDSDLEAFSHYPADGSFAALPGRAAAKTNYLNQRFLSY
jgi:hypothetical protein